MKKEYSLVLKNNRRIKCSIKELIKYNPKLILSSDREVYSCDNIQSLYLYPLSIIDYINNLQQKRIIFLNIISIDLNLDYIQLLNDKRFKFLKAVEILIQQNFNKDITNKICELVDYLSARNVLISLNIKNINIFPDEILKKIKKVAYFKVFLKKDITRDEYLGFLNKLSLISEYSDKNALLHIKTYLDLQKIYLYEKMMNDFSKLGVDVFQVSKELIPFDTENIEVDNKYQNIIRNLEKKYHDYSNCKFISVKNISTLYYDRFKLDERNSKKCYASRMKPYLYNDMIIPCKVDKVLLNLKKWNLNNSDESEVDFVLKKCGTTCDDCASIFENDLLYKIDLLVDKYECDIILKEQ